MINTIELKKVIGLSSKIPQNDKKEFVLVGRSNVGKSSFINAISNRKNYAKTSSTPGKTRTINFYLCDNKFYLVDLPGYGYAKTSYKEQNDFATFINKYFNTSKMIEEIIMLVDIRHKPTNQDIEMYNFILDVTGFEPIIIATKLDKIKPKDIDTNIKLIKETLMAGDDITIIPFSATTKTGCNEIYNILKKLID